MPGYLCGPAHPAILREHIAYQDTGKFGATALAYLAGDERLSGLYQWPFDREGLKQAANSRQFPKEVREDLVRTLHEQYGGMDVPTEVRHNLNMLAQDGTLTVTAGHQCCLFTGPLFFPIKVINAIRIARDLAKELGTPVVPVLWLATEDHDRDEIDHTFVNGERLEWPEAKAGAVGRMKLKDIGPVLDRMQQQLGGGSNAVELMDLFREAYRPEHDLSKATRILANGLFGRFGLVVLDADDARLKARFGKVMQQELEQSIAKTAIAVANERLNADFKVQAHARDINLFYLSDGSRERIERIEDGFVLVESQRNFNKDQLLNELREHPERISPNVILRPLYQETILPNIAYVGGGGELAYWLQLKPLFDEVGTSFLQLVMRSSAMFLNAKAEKRMKQLGLVYEDLFSSVHELERKVAVNGTDRSPSVEAERATIEELYGELADRAEQIDPTLKAMVEAERTRTMRSIERVEKKMVRSIKRQQGDELRQLHELLDLVMPGGGLQERKENFSSFYAEQGPALFDQLLEMAPYQKRFTIFR